MSEYCSPSDLYSYGLPRGALANPGRVAASVSAATDSFVLGEHGFSTDDPVTFRAEADGNLPSPLVEGVIYYAVVSFSDTFSVAASVGGAPIDLTTDGMNVIVIAPLPIQAAIQWASSIIEDMVPAHLVPFEAPIHDLVRATCAELAAGKLLTIIGAGNKSLSEMIDAAHKRLARWARGVPLRGENVPKRANLAVGATSASTPDPTGWRRYGGI